MCHLEFITQVWAAVSWITVRGFTTSNNRMPSSFVLMYTSIWSFASLNLTYTGHVAVFYWIYSEWNYWVYSTFTVCGFQDPDVVLCWRPWLLNLSWSCLPAGDGDPTGGLCCHVPVWHSGVWFHHSSCHPHSGVPAQVCVGAAGPRH